jgi:Rod binding domain-containing protein
MFNIMSPGIPAKALPITLPTRINLVGRPSNPSLGEDGKIDKSAKDFESILLGSWLQQAEESFAKLPGGDDEEDADPGKEQFQGMAMQSLGTSMTASGGIGIAKMISKQLHKTDGTSQSAATENSVVAPNPLK